MAKSAQVGNFPLKVPAYLASYPVPIFLPSGSRNGNRDWVSGYGVSSLVPGPPLPLTKWPRKRWSGIFGPIPWLASTAVSQWQLRFIAANWELELGSYPSKKTQIQLPFSPRKLEKCRINVGTQQKLQVSSES